MSNIGTIPEYNLTIEVFLGAILLIYSLISECRSESLICIPVKESSKTSLNFEEDLFISPRILVGYESALFRLIQSLFHLIIKSFKSAFNSPTLRFFATVLTITPNPFGLIDLTRFLSLFFS